MQYGHSNGISAFLVIAVGAAAFAAWLYVCYPFTAVAVADQSRQSWSFVVLIGFVVVAVIGVSIASSVLQSVMALLKNLVQLSLIVAVVAAGVWAWRGQQTQTPATRPAAPNYPGIAPGNQFTQPLPPASVPPEEPSPKPAKSRWWEQNKQE